RLALIHAHSLLYRRAPSISTWSTIAMMVASTGRSLVTLVCRADEPAAYSTTSPTPAPTASTATTVLPVGLPSASHALTRRNLSPESSSSLRVATTVPTTLPITIESTA